MKRDLTVLFLGLLSLPVGSAALAAPSCPTSVHDPASFDGVVGPPSAPQNVHFAFSADVEVPSDCNIRNIRCIANVHDKEPLWVRWPAAYIYHDSPWSRLEPKSIALRDQPVPGYDPVPDTNAPIEYTQKPEVQPATVYHAQSIASCPDRTEQNRFESRIESKIRGANNEPIDISIEVNAVSDGSDTFNEIIYEPTDLTITIDGTLRQLDFEDMNRIHEVMSQYGADWKIDAFESLVAEEQHQYLPNWMLRSVVLAVTSPGKFLIPVNVDKQPQAGDSFVAALDPEGHVLVTGITTIFAPR